jgi:chemotaxis methyl-accepting protein methylase
MKKSAPPPARKRTVKPAAPAPRKTLPKQAPVCPIVGIGASAGGLEALVQFLEHVPKDSGMAYVIVQHLDPTQKGMMPELLQRATTLKVMQVTDRTKALPNCVYVIPPNSDMSVLRGVLHLLVPVELRGLRLPIDFFFRSLAEDQREQSIGIILSGMGSDGTLGLRAIKEKAGIVLVQDPTTAKFDTMPRSVIDAGLADIVAPAEALPDKLIAYRRHLPHLEKAELHLEEKVQSALEKIVILLRAHSGHDFTLYRRVERRMGIHQVGKISGYVRYLQENPQELGILFKELLIGVTNFFRDKTSWEQLAAKALPLLLKDRPPGSTLRAWVAGCSTGEEAYTLAMVFKETLKHLKITDNVSLQIYATDLDKDAIDKARLGLFPENIIADVSPTRLSRFFVKEENGYRVNKEIRSMVVFAPQNLIMDPPFTKLDLLSCRNLLIYLTPELQKKLFPLFHYSLNPGGVLFLGSAESIGNFTHLFTALALKERIFQRNETAMQSSHLDFPAVYVPSHPSRQESQTAARVPAPSLQSLADQMLQQRYAPPAVLVNEHGDILYISGKTGKFLEPAAGKANWNVIAMAHDGLRTELSSAMQKVIRKKGTVTVRGIKLGPAADTRAVDIMVQAIEEPKELFGMLLIVFSESIVAAEPQSDRAKGKATASNGARQRELQNELKRAHEEVQAGREEMQTSQEELKSMNEELQSTNEELQSTNEELMTSKEEMQSLNEELQTVNAELQAKLNELSGTNNDMKNLLNSTDIATVFLDNDLHVRRFTLQAKTIIKFIASDVGRPITDLASDLLYPELVKDAHEVLRTLVFSERSIATENGRWFTVRIMPYRTMDNRIDGVVITFADITAAKKIEAELREQHRKLSKHSVEQGRALDKALGTSKRRSAADPKRKSKS